MDENTKSANTIDIIDTIDTIDAIDMFAFHTRHIEDIIKEEYQYAETLPKQKHFNDCWLMYFDEYKKENYDKIIEEESKSNLRTVKINYEYNNRYSNPNNIKVNTAELNEYLDTYVYQKPWGRLKNVHKNIKIKEYVNSLKYPDDLDENKINENKLHLNKKLSEFIENKDYKQKDYIKYDEDNGKILDISCVIFSKSKKVYKIIL
jgi:hypothetical protein